MEADFSGYVTKAGLTCTDGRTIMPDAFKHQDKARVPLVWQHGHTDPENVLGYVELENRKDGVFGHAFFNKTKKAQHAKEAVSHKDITMMSIWANNLVQKAKQVFHGKIHEVSLVLSGANPGALIENVQIRHSDGEVEELEDELIIHTGLQFGEEPDDLDDDDDQGNDMQHSEDDPTIEDVYNSMTEDQQKVVQYMVGQALEEGGSGDMQQSALDEFKAGFETGFEKGSENQMGVVSHNVFDQDDKKNENSKYVLSHSEMEQIFTDAAKPNNTLATAVKEFAEAHLEHGIQDIDILFPEARTVGDMPEFLARRVEWVTTLMGGVRKTPFSRIKTFNADITMPEARAKGYIKGNLKKEEFFRVAKRVTTPTTIYKKQKLDRDDIIDITDFDVVVWMKGEMRLMLDEEIARAILVGDGRAADDDDKINEDSIRPIATDHELYTTKVNVNLGDTDSSVEEALDAIILYRSSLRGTGTPTLFTTEQYIARFLLIRDDNHRKIYKNLEEVATDLRVKEIVAVEVLEEYPDILGILVNPYDYVVGADKGGQVSLFDDFDIDYNQYKYLIETRMSGALTKLKSALVVNVTASSDILVVPTAPTFDGEFVTIHDTTHVVYRNADTDVVINNAGSPYVVAEGDTYNIVAEPAAGYYFSDSDVDDWQFTNNG